MKIILISGKAEAGKTLTAHILKEKLEARNQKVALASYGQYVKDTAKMLFGWDGKKDEAGRTLLQHWGTEIVRKKEPNFWIDTVLRLYNVIKDEFDYLIIDDCRFSNEIERWLFVIPALEITTIRVERPGHENALTPEQRQHASEVALDDFPFDVYLTATNKEELEKEIERKVLC